MIKKTDRKSIEKLKKYYHNYGLYDIYITEKILKMTNITLMICHYCLDYTLQYHPHLYVV